MKKRILACYVFSALKYACESWTITKLLEKRIDAFEQWCYRWLMKISWKDKIRNEDVLKTVQEEKVQLWQKIIQQKLSYAGHVLRGTSVSSALFICEGKFEGKKAWRCLRRMWVDDIYQCTSKRMNEEVKRVAMYRAAWRKLTHQPSYKEDGTND